MVLVIGGIASGKHTYVHSLGYADRQFGRHWKDDLPVLCDLSDVLREGALGDEAFEALSKKDVVICNEVGMGVVPVDAEERAWRERVGRTTALLAQCADQVVRMVAGIPVRLK